MDNLVEIKRKTGKSLENFLPGFFWHRFTAEGDHKLIYVERLMGPSICNVFNVSARHFSVQQIRMEVKPGRIGTMWFQDLIPINTEIGFREIFARIRNWGIVNY